MSDGNSADYERRRNDDLIAERTKLQTAIGRLRTKIDQLGTENEKFKADLGKITAERDTLATERDTFKSKAEQLPGDLTTKIATLEGQIRHRDHRDAYGAVKEFDIPSADGKPPRKYRLNDGVTPDAVWKQMGYTPEGDTPDGKAISEQYRTALASHPFLFAEVTAGSEGRPGSPLTMTARESGPGGGKGSISPTVAAATGDRFVHSGSGVPGRL